jgi:hypothetical protein
MSSVIYTDRLMLVPATVTLCDAEYEGPTSVGKLLGATMPASWPPAVFERDDVDRVRHALASDPEAQAWTLHYLLRCHALWHSAIADRDEAVAFTTSCGRVPS